MSASHTPGPWKAHFQEAYFVTGPDLGRVAMMMNLKGAHGLGGRRSGDESAANCRLIAAAPELLEALRLMIAIHDEPAGFAGKYGKALDAAIAQQKEKIDARLKVARDAIAKATGAPA